MVEAPLSREVRRFILAFIPSVPHLEALLLLRNEAATAWTEEALARRLYVERAVARALLSHLVGKGLVEPCGEGAFCFAPASQDIVQAVTELEGAYTRNLVAVANLIHSIVDQKAQRFADAFRWRKDPER